MRNERDHVFIDCGPVGLAGLGGHGHNDCLSFEAVLDGVHLVSDCGAYVYTASVEERNRFRSTAYHNTPQIDSDEINRFVRWDHLWTLHNDALPEVLRWEKSVDRDLFVGTHTGYRRLDDPVSPVRTIVLDHEQHVLTVTDEIQGVGEHVVSIPLHLACDVEARIEDANRIALKAGGREFLLIWSGTGNWAVEIGSGRISPSYGVVVPSLRLLWRRRGALPATLTLQLLSREAAARADARRSASSQPSAVPA